MARLGDSSTSRVQVLLSTPRGLPLGEVGAHGYRIPLQPVYPSRGELPRDRDYALSSVIYRAFVPQVGLHLHVPAHDPWLLEWTRGNSCQRVQLHAWHLGGSGYAGLPLSATEARERRRARVLVSQGAVPRRFLQVDALGDRLDLRTSIIISGSSKVSAPPSAALLASARRRSRQVAQAVKDP